MLINCINSYDEWCITFTLNHLGQGHVEVLCGLLFARLVHLKTAYELILVCYFHLEESWLHLTHLHELCEDVVAFSTVSWELIIRISLEHVCSCLYQISNYLEVASMGCQMERCPFVHPATRIQIKLLEFILNTNRLVQFDNSLDSLFLILPYSSMQCSPVIRVFLVDIGTIHD